MAADSRQKRSRLGNQRFLLSIFYTLLLLSLYLTGLYYIPAPELFLGQLAGGQRQLGEIPRQNLLGWVLNYQLQINFVLYLSSALFTAVSTVLLKKPSDEEKRKLRDIRSTFSRFLKPNIIASIGVFRYWNLTKNSSYLVLLTYLSFFVSNSVFELIIGFLDDYGVCGGFDLIFLIDRFPFKLVWKLILSLLKTILFSGDYSDFRRSFLLLLISTIAYFFILLSNKKWEVPISINRINPNENYIDYSPTFLLQANFDIFPLTLIPDLIRLCGVFLSFLLESPKNLRNFPFVNELSTLWKNFGNFSVNSSSFKEVFFAINSSVNPFLSFYQRGRGNINFFPAITAWTLILHFTNWLFISNSHLDSREISKTLEKSGAYFDNVRPGEETKKLVSHVVNSLVTQWALCLVLFTIVFDNIIFGMVNKEEVSLRLASHHSSYYHNNLSLPSLLMTTSRFVDVSKQIKKQYNSSKFYD